MSRTARRRTVPVIGVLVGAVVSTALVTGPASPTAAAEPTPAPTATAGPSAAPLPTDVPSSTPTDGPTATSSPTATSVPTVTATPIAPIAPITPPTPYVRTGADRRIAVKLAARTRTAAVGPRLGAVVIDAASGTTVWGTRAATAYLPASTTKLTTAVIALRTLGSQRRLQTNVVADPAFTTAVLVGAGDPTLTSAQVRVLGRAAAAGALAAGRTVIDVGIDDRLFGSTARATGWPPSYYPGSVSPVRALQVDERASMDTALAAAKVFAAAVRDSGVAVGRIRRTAAPVDAVPVASATSASVGDMVARMLNVSDNDYAEALLRLSAIASGLPPTWAGERALQKRVLAAVGVPLTGVRLYDGSGLSRADRIPARTLAALVRLITADPTYAAALRGDALPIAGVSGSLRPARHRFVTNPSRCAAGRLRAKTGTLRDVVSLAGFTTGTDGRLKVFAFVLNGRRSTLATRRAVDALAATVTGCY